MDIEHLTDEQLKTFLSRVRTHDLIAYLRTCSRSDVNRILSLLSPMSAENIRKPLTKLLHNRRGSASRAEQILQGITDSNDVCIFCKIAAGEAPASILYQDDQIMAFMDLYPVTSGHLLIIPKQHVSSIEKVNPDVAAQMMQKAQQIGHAIMASKMGCDGYNLFAANGGAAGQEVFHVHLHILPRHHGDGFGFIFPAHYPQEASRELLDVQVEMLKPFLWQR